MNANSTRHYNHVSHCTDTELDMLGFLPEDDMSSMCPSLVVYYTYSVDENCFWPELRCAALADAEMLINNEACEWSPGYDEDIPF